jgi:MoaA/NifB/PqqE/SkfB family radical SAM enzyme
MKKISLMLTHLCNESCSYCPIEKSDKSMSLSVAKNIIDSLRDDNERCIIKFFGGEPLLCYKTIEKIVLYGGDSFGYEITTNGKKLDKNILRFFIKNKVDLTLSFDFDFKKNFDTLVMFENNIDLLTINLLVRPGDVSSLYENFEELIEHGVRKFNFLPANYTVLWEKYDLDILEKQFEKIIKLYLTKKCLGQKLYFKGFEDLEEENLKNSHLASHNLFFDTDGSAYLSDAILLLPKSEREKYRISKFEDFKFTSHDNSLINSLEVDLANYWGEERMVSNGNVKKVLDRINKLIN